MKTFFRPKDPQMPNFLDHYWLVKEIMLIDAIKYPNKTKLKHGNTKHMTCFHENMNVSKLNVDPWME